MAALALLAVLSAVALPAALPALASTAKISLVMNGQPVETDVPPIIVNDRTLVPIRVISETMGAVVAWDQATRMVTITTGYSHLTLTVGQTTATIDGRPYVLDSPPRIVSDRTLVPIRFIIEGLGGRCEWVQETRQVVISYNTGEAMVEGVHWHKAAGTARLAIVTTGPVSYRATSLAADAQHPARIVVEVDRARTTMPAETVINAAGIRQVSVSTIASESSVSVRLIFDLDEPLLFTAWTTWTPGAPLSRDELPGGPGPGREAVVLDIQYRLLAVDYIPEPGAERMAIRLSGPAEYRLWEASNPWRLVLDFDRTTIAAVLTHRSIPLGASGLTGSRWADHPGYSRVVIEAAAAVPYSVIRDGDNVLIYIGGTATITGIGYDRTPVGGRLTVSADRPAAATVTRTTGPDQVTVEIPGARLGPGLTSGETLRLDDELVREVSYRVDPVTQKVILTMPVGAATWPSTPVATSSGFTIDLRHSTLTGRIIVIDPGHGGTDPGAIAKNGTREVTLNHAIAAILVDKLRAAGATVHVTCAPTQSMDKYERAAIANAHGAEAFVSVHLNANNSSAVCGSEVYYSDTHADSRRLSQLILARLVNHLGRPNGGIRFMPAFAVIREPVMPSCLVEALYLTNPDDLAILMSPSSRETIAQAIFEGLWEFFTTR